jgi:predicted nucleotide-binding protein (sugar kinase/HSP70/actin superfamily)
MIEIGIPRALLYYQYFPIWKTFFEELGGEIVASTATTKAMIASGSSRVVGDTCLPVKVFLGHVLSLIGSCDYIFIPVIRSLKSNIYNCSKFLGLPDMTRAVIAECPPILEVEIDINKGKGNLYRAIDKLGRYFTRDKSKIRRAASDAWQVHLNYRQLMCKYALTLPEAMKRISNIDKTDDFSMTTENVTYSGSPVPTQTNIAVIGHPYLLYDEYLNHHLIHRIEEAGSRVLTPEMLTSDELESASVRLAGTPYWTYGEEVVGAGEHYLQDRADGIVGISTFGCGPDSLMMEMVHRRANSLGNKPFMSLVLEEHTAETGIITRLEAFLDMINRRKRGGQ